MKVFCNLVRSLHKTQKERQTERAFSDGTFSMVNCCTHHTELFKSVLEDIENKRAHFFVEGKTLYL